MYAESYGTGSRHPVLTRTTAALAKDRARAVIAALEQAEFGTLRTRSGAFSVRPRLAAGPGRELVLTLDDASIDLASLEIDSLEFRWGEKIFAIDTNAIRVRERTLRMRRPEQIFDTRRHGVELHQGAARLHVDWDGELLELPLIEFAPDELVVTGLTGAELSLRRHRASLLVMDGDVDLTLDCAVSFRGFGNVGETRLQLHVAPEHRSMLAHAFARCKFPRLHDRGAFAAAAVIELFRSSRYLDLRAGESRPTPSWCRPEFAGDLSVDRVYQAEDGALLGHVSVTRAYSRTWLGHQLSTLKGHPESGACRVALYNHFASVPQLFDGRDEVYLLGYYDRSLRWHQLFFEGFVAWLGDARRATLVGFDRFEPLERAGSVEDPDPGELVIEPLAAAELGDAVALVRAQLPELAHEAFDIAEDRLVTEHLHPAYAERGVERGRRVLGVRERGELVGVALCETGSVDLSLFNLFNLAQLYFRVGPDRRPAISRAAQVGLVRAVRGFYAARGIDDPVIVAPPGQFVEPAAAGLRLDETMGCILWSGASLELYPDYLRDCFDKIDAASLTKAS